ncbi:methyltransferase [Amaricoccus sp.]|uniref:class I SAM-dependent methyltransferase n=1 Tax=Amaricoccus sp. TaxID=1872485 RepID=UPI001B64C842|nr:methyltransferase [Amaricoccus sp.]MBP6999951.1 class I SAM-dependent methyltransferase [Amaricoccus sp.]
MSRTDRAAAALLSGELPVPAAGDVLVIRAVGPALAEALPRERLLFEQSFKPAHDALAAAGLRVTLRAAGPAAMGIVTLTRSRAENLGNLARAFALTPPGATLALDGAKTDGVDSLARQVGAVLPLAGSFAKAHGKVVWLTRPADPPPEVAAWAAAAEPSRNAAGFLTAPGLFSADAPDPGSRRLAEAVAGRLSGRVADLGAGWGWLAAQALATCPGIVALDLFEAEARALDCARANVPDPRAAFHWADVPRLARRDGPFDAVLCNPPFHETRAADPALGAAFIAAAARLLRPAGRLFLVANRQLPYESALAAGFARVEKLSEEGGFKLYLADRPRRA